MKIYSVIELSMGEVKEAVVAHFLSTLCLKDVILNGLPVEVPSDFSTVEDQKLLDLYTDNDLGHKLAMEHKVSGIINVDNDMEVIAPLFDIEDVPDSVRWSDCLAFDLNFLKSLKNNNSNNEQETPATVNFIFQQITGSWFQQEASDKDISDVKSCIQQCINWGFTAEDTIAYVNCIEQVNPDLDEKIALARMKSISDKYPQK